LVRHGYDLENNQKLNKKKRISTESKEQIWNLFEQNILCMKEAVSSLALYCEVELYSYKKLSFTLYCEVEPFSKLLTKYTIGNQKIFQSTKNVCLINKVLRRGQPPLYTE